jgi:hypothetical protein
MPIGDFLAQRVVKMVVEFNLCRGAEQGDVLPPIGLKEGKQLTAICGQF